jgi:ADP-ribosylglycohydrolase
MNPDPAAILYGLALGDAFGAPVEFLTLPQIKTAYGTLGIQQPPNPALYTDDTQMTVALAEGLLDAGLDAPIDSQMQAVGSRFIDWLNSPDNDRAPGRTCISGVERYESGIRWDQSGLDHSKGCGSAMRIATIGYFYQHDPARLRQVALASSMITHRHPTALVAAVAAAYAIKLALDGVSVGHFIPRTMEFTDGMSGEFDAALYRVGHVGAWADEEAALQHIGQGWVAEEAVALALYCVLRYPDDYTACVRRAANTNGDSDSIACIAGGIMGARLGVDAIPSEWLSRCENRDYLETLASRMAASRTELSLLDEINPKA